MICTPEEAKQKWCEATRHVDENHGPANRLGDTPNPQCARCIADECMSWNFIDDKRGYCGRTSDGQEYIQTIADQSSKQTKTATTNKGKKNGGKSGNKANQQDTDGTE